MLVPVIEELFWRGWLMRYLINPAFQKVPLGAYTGTAFWATAVLFATEHGAYWEAGLLAGLIYNWWMIRTGNLADCMVAHAVTNSCLAVYVVAFRPLAILAVGSFVPALNSNRKFFGVVRLGQMNRTATILFARHRFVCKRWASLCPVPGKRSSDHQ